MFRKPAFLCLFLGLGWLANPLCAQTGQEETWQYKVEFFGNVAHGRFYHGDSLLGKGLDYGGGVGVRPFSGKLRGLGFEIQVAHLASNQSKSVGLSQSLDSRLVAASALYHFRNRTRVQPYVFGGIGNVKADYTSSCKDCVFAIDPVTGKLVSIPQQWSTQGNKNGILLGGGIKIAVSRHLSIRPECMVVDTTAGEGPNWGWFRFQIGLGLHF